MNFHQLMMEATCKIQGPNSIGTGFILGRPLKFDPVKAAYTLVTAHHVLAGITGEVAQLVLQTQNSAGSWERVDHVIPIRSQGKDLWSKHPTLDLAACFVRLPANGLKTIIPTTRLLADADLSKYEITVGEELLCLGYPFGQEANALGFPILRSGRIASFPLLPVAEFKTFLFDFSVFPGNSGGPVYLHKFSPTYGGIVHMSETIFGIVGLVTQQRMRQEQVQQLYERRETMTPLALGEVIQATFIRELVDSLPEPPE